MSILADTYMSTNKLIIICGPTATGKTDLALKLAQKFNGEIISADSRQVYRGMDWGTGKGIQEFRIQNSELNWQNQKLTYYEKDSIKIWGHNLVDPDQDFSLAHFKQFSSLIIKDIHSRHKLPIIVGGTGLYLKTFSHHINTTSIPPDPKLRSQLEKQSIQQLQQKLNQLNHKKLELMNRSDRHNPRRLIRAIEIENHHRQSSPINPGINDPGIVSISNINKSMQLWIGLTAPFKTLDIRVGDNVKTRSHHIDLEIKTLLSQLPNFWSFQSSTTIGYHQWRQYLTGQISKTAAIKLWTVAETQYLRRQITWFKKQKQVHWFDISQPNFTSQVERQVKDWYSNLNAIQSTINH